MDRSDKDGRKINKEKAYKEARQQIREKARSSRVRLSELLDRDSFEELLRRQQEERQKERREQRRKRAARKTARENTASKSEESSESLTAYKAKAAQKHISQNRFGEGFLNRAVRLVTTLVNTRRELAGDTLVTDEKRRAAYAAVISDCCSPITTAASEAVETAWHFVTELGRDAWEVVLFVCDMIIAAAYYISSFALLLWDLLWDLRFWLDIHKKGVFQVFASLVSLGMLVIVFINSLIGYEYSYYGKALGIAKSEEDVYKTIAILGDKLSAATGANISIDVERDIEFKKLIGFDLDIDKPDDILDTLTYLKDIQVRAYAVNVNGEQTVVLEDEESAREMLEQVKKDALLGRLDTEYTESSFVEDVEITEVGVLLGDIWNSNAARHYLETGSVNAVPLDTDVPKLNVQSTELYTYYESINFGTRYIDNNSMYKDETELVSAGKPGRQENVARIVRINGEETSRELVSSVRIEEPVAEVYYRGTKSIPARVGTGTFAYPINTYTITSRFGMRWGRMHTGVDFAAPTGTKLFAADGGTVTYAGSKGSYGNLVIISHGGGFETYYAHCSKILVEVGDSVYQGQNIALCGSTGNSTGPHLHFEVRYDGEPGNPLDYLQ